jgi:predicted alpha/beta hydrolase family esterase
VLLVAPADVDRPGCTPEILDFAPIPMQRLPFPATLVASESDPYCSIDRARTLASSWGADFVNIGDAGHINADAGFGEWRQGEDLLRDLIARSDSDRCAAAGRTSQPREDA